MTVLLTILVLILAIIVWRQQVILARLAGDVRVVKNRPDLLVASWDEYRRAAECIGRDLSEHAATLALWQKQLKTKAEEQAT